MTTVVNIKTCPDFNPKANPSDVYIGRYYPGKPFFPASRWRNPFKVGQDGTREGAIEKYRQYILQKPKLLAQIPDLKRKRLGCWCKPKACHGDLLAAWADNGVSGL
jgi:hypothetical protein